MKNKIFIITILILCEKSVSQNDINKILPTANKEDGQSILSKVMDVFYLKKSNVLNSRENVNDNKISLDKKSNSKEIDKTKINDDHKFPSNEMKTLDIKDFFINSNEKLKKVSKVVEPKILMTTINNHDFITIHNPQSNILDNDIKNISNIKNGLLNDISNINKPNDNLSIKTPEVGNYVKLTNQIVRDMKIKVKERIKRILESKLKSKHDQKNDDMKFNDLSFLNQIKPVKNTMTNEFRLKLMKSLLAEMINEPENIVDDKRTGDDNGVKNINLKMFYKRILKELDNITDIYRNNKKK